MLYLGKSVRRAKYKQDYSKTSVLSSDNGWLPVKFVNVYAPSNAGVIEALRCVHVLVPASLGPDWGLLRESGP